MKKKSQQFHVLLKVDVTRRWLSKGEGRCMFKSL